MLGRLLTGAALFTSEIGEVRQKEAKETGTVGGAGHEHTSETHFLAGDLCQHAGVIGSLLHPGGDPPAIGQPATGAGQARRCFDRSCTPRQILVLLASILFWNVRHAGGGPLLRPPSAGTPPSSLCKPLPDIDHRHAGSGRIGGVLGLVLFFMGAELSDVLRCGRGRRGDAGAGASQGAALLVAGGGARARGRGRKARVKGRSRLNLIWWLQGARRSCSLLPRGVSDAGPLGAGTGAGVRARVCRPGASQAAANALRGQCQLWRQAPSCET